MATILPSYLVNNKTLDLEIRESGFAYDIQIHKIHINTLNINERWVDFVPGTRKIRLHFGKIDMDSTLDGQMTIIGIIPLHAATLNSKGLIVQADLEAIILPDGIHWQLVQTTFVDLNDVTITTTSSVWNTMIAPFHGVIVSMVRAQLPQINAAIQKIVDDLNKRLKEGGSNFMTNVFDANFPLNLTTTQAPQADNTTKLVTINFDGTFFDTARGTNHVSKNTIFPARIPNLNSNQVFIHQSMIASLVLALAEENLPITINDVNLTGQIL